MSVDLPPGAPRVLHLTIAMARGGRRDAILTLARAGRHHGFASWLATLRGSGEEVAPFTSEFSGIAQLQIEGLPSLRQIVDLRDRCREWGITVVHAHDASSQFVASTLRSVAPSLRVVMTFHRSLGFESAGFRSRLRNAISLIPVTRVLTASEERRGHFLAENWVPPTKVTTIPLGIDLNRFRPDPEARRAVRAELGIGESQPMIVAAGHYGEEKGIDLAIAAAQSAAKELADPPILVVMGTGHPDRIAAITQLARSVRQGEVRLLGQRSDPERVLAAGDLLLHTPRLEAFGLVVVQAMACGLPAVAAAVGGIPEVVVDGATGLLTPVGDAAAAGSAVATLVADPALRRRLGKAGLARARREYPDSLFAARYRDLYLSLSQRG